MIKDSNQQPHREGKRPKPLEFKACAKWIRKRYKRAHDDWALAQLALKEAREYEIDPDDPNGSKEFKRLRQMEARADLTPSRKPTNILLQETYRLIRLYRKREMMLKLEKYLVKRDGRPKNVQAWVNPYHLGLILVFGPKSEKLSNQNRSKYAQMLDYADRNNVPWQLLPGFLYQAGSYEVIRDKHRGIDIEPGFKKLVDKAQSTQA